MVKRALLLSLLIGGAVLAGAQPAAANANECGHERSESCVDSSLYLPENAVNRKARIAFHRHDAHGVSITLENVTLVPIGGHAWPCIFRITARDNVGASYASPIWDCTAAPHTLNWVLDDATGRIAVWAQMTDPDGVTGVSQHTLSLVDFCKAEPCAHHPT
jgi:hypothetical protein